MRSLVRYVHPKQHQYWNEALQFLRTEMHLMTADEQNRSLSLLGQELPTCYFKPDEEYSQVCLPKIKSRWVIQVLRKEINKKKISLGELNLGLWVNGGILGCKEKGGVFHPSENRGAWRKNRAEVALTMHRQDLVWPGHVTPRTHKLEAPLRLLWMMMRRRRRIEKDMLRIKRS